MQRVVKRTATLVQIKCNNHLPHSIEDGKPSTNEIVKIGIKYIDEALTE